MHQGHDPPSPQRQRLLLLGPQWWARRVPVLTSIALTTTAPSREPSVAKRQVEDKGLALPGLALTAKSILPSWPLRSTCLMHRVVLQSSLATTPPLCLL